jgi:phenylalanyl-tRNA synthetase beta chain
MRVPLSWLREYVDVQLTPEQLAERLTLLGMEVKGIDRWGAHWRNVVVGELLTVARHPRTDRLSLTTVAVGSGPALEIVCGATNIAPGQRVPVALPGAVLPDGRQIDRVEKAGVVSEGMLCSGDELNLTSDGEGILILPADAPLGAPLADLYADVVLDVDVKPNRGDALSMLGLAREVAAVTGAPVRWPDIEVAEAGETIEARLEVEVEDPRLCSRFVGRWVSGVRIGPSPDRVQMRLLAAGMRPVSNVVDASNYVMLELGKPIHTFDAAGVHDRRIVVRTARPGEQLETLDHVTRSLTPDTLLIADPAGPLAIAGVMGGAASEIGPGTTEVIIESAIFDPISIRRTGQHYALRSEASLRFEKGQEPRLARIGADRCAQHVAAWAGGTVAPGRVDTAPTEPTETRVAFRPARVNRLLGTTLAPAEQQALLGRVGVATESPTDAPAVVISAGSRPLTVAAAAGETLLAVVPTWRRDIAIEADIAEEIARVRGYELVPAMLPRTAIPPWRPNPLELRDMVRETLAGAGVSEVVTHALVSPRHLEAFAWSTPEPLAEGETAARGERVVVTNPLSSEHALLRQGLLASLADAVASNLRHGRVDVWIFEIGKGYGRVSDETSEWWRLAVALAGHGDPPAWNRPARPVDLDDIKGLVELVGRRLGLESPAWRPLRDEPLLHPGRAATGEARDREGRVRLAGRAGELHPALLERWELRTDRLVVAELSISGLSGGSVPAVRTTPPPRFPAAERDLAVVVGRVTSAAAVEAGIRAAGGDLLRSVALFDVYTGPPLTAEERSLAWRLVFSAPDRTLTDDEVDAAVAAIISNLGSAVGGRVRR